jgi:DNA-binding response OmpR family regulator
MSKLIAIVEDEPDIRKLIVHHLEKANFNVKEFQDGDSFFKFIDDNLPDLIVLDIMLPDSDGFEICKYLKSKSQFSNVPIIILTAKNEEIDKVLEVLPKIIEKLR